GRGQRWIKLSVPTAAKNAIGSSAIFEWYGGEVVDDFFRIKFRVITTWCDVVNAVQTLLHVANVGINGLQGSAELADVRDLQDTIKRWLAFVLDGNDTFHTRHVGVGPHGNGENQVEFGFIKVVCADVVAGATVVAVGNDHHIIKQWATAYHGGSGIPGCCIQVGGET